MPTSSCLYFLPGEILRNVDSGGNPGWETVNELGGGRGAKERVRGDKKWILFYPSLLLFSYIHNFCLFWKTGDISSQTGLSPSTKLSVRSAVICSTLTEEIVAFSGECYSLFRTMSVRNRPTRCWELMSPGIILVYNFSSLAA